jgi:hypothetical protein
MAAAPTATLFAQDHKRVHVARVRGVQGALRHLAAYVVRAHWYPSYITLVPDNNVGKRYKVLIHGGFVGLEPMDRPWKKQL